MAKAAQNKQTFTLQADFKALAGESDGKTRRVSGYASTFGNEDRHNDIIAPGAFSEWVSEFGAGRRICKMCWQHDIFEPVGVWNMFRVDQKGLYCEGTIFSDIPEGFKVARLIEGGAIDSMSIGYIPTEFEINPRTGVRTLTKIELVEVSFVTFPANPEAVITNIKSQPTSVDLCAAFVSQGFDHETATKMADLAVSGMKGAAAEEKDIPSLPQTIFLLEDIVNRIKGLENA